MQRPGAWLHCAGDSYCTFFQPAFPMLPSPKIALFFLSHENPKLLAYRKGHLGVGLSSPHLAAMWVNTFFAASLHLSILVCGSDTGSATLNKHSSKLLRISRWRWTQTRSPSEHGVHHLARLQAWEVQHKGLFELETCVCCLPNPHGEQTLYWVSVSSFINGCDYWPPLIYRPY